MDITKKLSKTQTVLLVMPSDNYNHLIVKITKKLSQDKKSKICYITLNKTADSLEERFAKEKIKTKNLCFIDAISKSIKNIKKNGARRYFVSSPGALNELSLAIDKALKHEYQYLIFDSLNSLLIYDNLKIVERFISVIMNKVRARKTKTILLALDLEEHQSLIKQCSMFVDEVIRQK